jgi:hypothetical protein
VRIEIAAALQHKITVIAILVDGGSLFGAQLCTVDQF